MRAKNFENEPVLHNFYSERAEELQELVMKIIEKFTQPEPISNEKSLPDEAASDQNGA